MSSTLFRLATMSDAMMVGEVTAAAYAPWIAVIGRHPGPMLDDHASLIAAGRVHVLEVGGLVRGVLVLVPEADGLWVHSVAVHPSCQGVGVGHLLMSHAERVAREKGFGSLRLGTNVAMASNIAFYRRLGFSETHRGEQATFHRVFMAKELG